MTVSVIVGWFKCLTYSKKYVTCDVLYTYIIDRTIGSAEMRNASKVRTKIHTYTIFFSPINFPSMYLFKYKSMLGSVFVQVADYVSVQKCGQLLQAEVASPLLFTAWGFRAEMNFCQSLPDLSRIGRLGGETHNLHKATMQVSAFLGNLSPFCAHQLSLSQ